MLRRSTFSGCISACMRVFAYIAGSFTFSLYSISLYICFSHFPFISYSHCLFFSRSLFANTCRTPHILPADVSDVTVRMHSKSVTSNFKLSKGGTCSISQPLIRSLALELCVYVRIHTHTSVWVCVCVVESARGIAISVCQISACMFVRIKKKSYVFMLFGSLMARLEHLIYM